MYQLHVDIPSTRSSAFSLVDCGSESTSTRSSAFSLVNYGSESSSTRSSIYYSVVAENPVKNASLDSARLLEMSSSMNITDPGYETINDDETGRGSYV